LPCMNNNDIELVLFDLGGVLVELGEELFPSAWLPDHQGFGLSEWFSSETAIKFETGLISSKEFISEFKRKLSITVSDYKVHAAFEAWPKGLFPSTDKLLNRLKLDYRIAVLSNSNQIHEPIIMQTFGLESRIDDVFFSHIIGHSKPSDAAFNHVLTELDFKPKQVMFFDDNAANVLAARTLGMQAYQVSSPVEVVNYI